jgi:redox-sensitive bicupin YhaK (pirin superfamily)
LIIGTIWRVFRCWALNVNYISPVRDLFVDVEYLDVHLSGDFTFSTTKRTMFLYVYEGSVTVGGEEIQSNHGALLTEQGDAAVKGNGRFLLVAGDPLHEPIAWGGPIVMNTQDELARAFQELDKGTFIKGSIPSPIAEDFYRL